jgi:hypothetical protein
MTYTPKIPSDPAYTRLLGQALYNFTYLEWVVLWTIVRLNGNDTGVLSLRETAGAIAKRFLTSIRDTTVPLPVLLRLELTECHDHFVAATKTRNHLLHAHPYTASDGAQRLTYSGDLKWPPEDVVKAAVAFEDLAIKVNDIFHGALAQIRP